MPCQDCVDTVSELLPTTGGSDCPSREVCLGVQSQKRCVLRMANVSYTYFEAIHLALANASISVSLSSRIAIPGDNGSGKSALLKLLTGELVPQWGKVETHPNLRIGVYQAAACLATRGDAQGENT